MHTMSILYDIVFRQQFLINQIFDDLISFYLEIHIIRQIAQLGSNKELIPIIVFLFDQVFESCINDSLSFRIPELRACIKHIHPK